jgi:hypothetical protein
MPHRARAGAEISHPRSEHDDGPERELDDDDPRRDHVTHRDREQRHGRDERDHRVALQPGGLARVGLADRLQAALARDLRVEDIRRHLVPRRADRRRHGLDVAVERDPRARQRQVDLGTGHAGRGEHRFLDPADARGARHPQDG